MAAGGDRILGPGGAVEILKLLYDFFAPGAEDSAYQERATRTLGECTGRVGLLRREVDAEMEMWRGSSGGFSVGALFSSRRPFPAREVVGAGQRLGDLGNFCGCPVNASTFRTARRSSTARRLGGDGCGCEFG